MMSAFFASVGEAITNILATVGEALGGGVGLIYDATANNNAGALTNFGILVSIPVGAGIVWCGYHILKRCLTLRG